VSTVAIEYKSPVFQYPYLLRVLKLLGQLDVCLSELKNVARKRGFEPPCDFVCGIP
jgi:hypothetical protein